MRFAPLLVLLLAAACHGAPPQAGTDQLSRVATMDTATARRICQSPDSVISGMKDCVLLDQSRRRDPQRQSPAPRVP